MSAAETIADLQAKRDAENAPPEGISRKAWGAMKNGWVPNQGTPMFDVWLAYSASESDLDELGLARDDSGHVEKKPPGLAGTGINIACIMIAAGLVSWLMASVFDSPRKLKMDQQCIVGGPLENCTEWSGKGNDRIAHDWARDKDAAGRPANRLTRGQGY